MIAARTPTTLATDAEVAALDEAVRALCSDPELAWPQRLRELFAIERQVRGGLEAEEAHHLVHLAQTGSVDPARAGRLTLAASALRTGYAQAARTHAEWSILGTEWTARVAVHALAHWSAAAKWRQARLENLAPADWLEGHALYRFAETTGVQHTVVALTDSDLAPRQSPTGAYLRGLLSAWLRATLTNPASLEIADAWFAAWCKDYALEQHYSPQLHVALVDLAKPAGLEGVTEGAKFDSVRYLRADALLLQLSAVAAKHSQQRRYPGSGPSHVFSLAQQAEVVAALNLNPFANLAPSGRRPESRVRREQLEVEVLTELDAILLVAATRAAGEDASGLGLAPLETARPHARDGLNPRLSSGNFGLPGEDFETASKRGAKLWPVYDFSVSGIALLVDSGTGEEIAHQRLLAMRRPGQSRWGLGYVVRKMTSELHGHTVLGIEMLGHHLAGVVLHRVPGQAARNARAKSLPPRRFPALYAPAPGGDARHDLLIIKRAEWAPEGRYTLEASGNCYRLRMHRAMAQGTDWLAMRFRVEAGGEPAR